MARIAGVDIPDNKRGEISLTYIFGIGRRSAQNILTEAGISWDKKVKDWNDDESNAVRAIIAEKFRIEGVLKSEIQLSIKRLTSRGQTTKNNASTRKGKCKTVANKKKATKG